MSSWTKYVVICDSEGVIWNTLADTKSKARDNAADWHSGVQSRDRIERVLIASDVKQIGCCYFCDICVRTDKPPAAGESGEFIKTNTRGPELILCGMCSPQLRRVDAIEHARSKLAANWLHWKAKALSEGISPNKPRPVESLIEADVLESDSR